MTLQEEFETLLKHYVKRDGVDKLLEMLSKSDFYTAPASTRYHESHESGLVMHSLNVFDALEEKSESSVLCALCHDICKIGFYKTSLRNAKNEQGKWVKVPFYEVEDLFPYGHGEKSVYLLQQCMQITDEEAMAIRWHMGIQPNMSFSELNAMGKAYEMFPLALDIHLADMKATYKPTRKINLD